MEHVFTPPKPLYMKQQQQSIQSQPSPKKEVQEEQYDMSDYCSSDEENVRCYHRVKEVEEEGRRVAMLDRKPNQRMLMHLG